MPNRPDLNQLLAILDQAYDHRSWHGTNLRGSSRGLSLQQAAWRPARGRHNIWELVVHSAYWKYAARRRLTGEARQSFPVKGSNWFARPVETTEKAWRSDIALLDEMHRRLRDAIGRFPPTKLHHKNGGSTDTNFSLIAGVAAHDLYHAGQVQLLKALERAKGQGLRAEGQGLRAKG
jgi:DinB family protein